jgi:sugar O-acyltransferase (sialic acid O-acetyltransferase NeuD family)
MEDIIIFPYSGTAIEALDCLNGNQRCVGFISDDENLIGKSFFGIEVYSREILIKLTKAKVLAVNGSPTSYLKRKEIIDSLKIEKKRFCNLIHPKASVSKNATIGYNVLIMAGVVITANAIIGNHICILPNTVIHHDSVINNYTLIAANNTICGNVLIGENCYIGAASSIKNGITVGTKTIVGIGSNIVKSVGENAIIKGNPAKI